MACASAAARRSGTTSTSAAAPRSARSASSAKRRYIAYDVRIGNRVKINALVYICTAVTIEDGVMISAGTIFTNDRFPRATTPDLKQLRASDARRAHAADAGARGRHDRRRLHHRQRPDDRPLRDGRHGLGRDQVRPGLSPGPRATRAPDRLRLPLRPTGPSLYRRLQPKLTLNPVPECHADLIQPAWLHQKRCGPAFIADGVAHRCPGAAA